MEYFKQNYFLKKIKNRYFLEIKKAFFYIYPKYQKAFTSLIEKEKKKNFKI